MSFRLIWTGIAVVFAIEAIVLLWVLADRHNVPFHAFDFQEAAQAQETGTCPDAQLIDTFEGNGNQQTDIFSTTTNSFRVSYEVTGSDPEFPASLFIDVIDADDPDQFPVANATQEGDGRGQTFANAPPGTYFLDISFFGGQYTVTVEQCEGGDPSRNPGAGRNRSDDNGGTARQPTGGGGIQRSSGNLLEAGGPLNGPMPLMMDGGCPEEYPEKRGNACHKQSK